MQNLSLLLDFFSTLIFHFNSWIRSILLDCGMTKFDCWEKYKMRFTICSTSALNTRSHCDWQPGGCWCRHLTPPDTRKGTKKLSVTSCIFLLDRTIFLCIIILLQKTKIFSWDKVICSSNLLQSVKQPKVSNLNRNWNIKFCPIFGHGPLVSDVAWKINTKYGFLNNF